MDINILRREIIKKRKELELEYRLRSADLAWEILKDMDVFKNSSAILVYADSSGEVPTDKIILGSLLLGKKVYAPVCGLECSMDFYQIYAIDELYPGSFGIREPLSIEYEKFDSTKVDDKVLAIVPGVLFDNDNNRVGYGRGYYDRFFERISINNRIGLCYDFQITDSIARKEHDIPMTELIIV